MPGHPNCFKPVLLRARRQFSFAVNKRSEQWSFTKSLCREPVHGVHAMLLILQWPSTFFFVSHPKLQLKKKLSNHCLVQTINDFFHPLFSPDDDCLCAGLAFWKVVCHIKKTLECLCLLSRPAHNSLHRCFYSRSVSLRGLDEESSCSEVVSQQLTVSFCFHRCSWIQQVVSF